MTLVGQGDSRRFDEKKRVICRELKTLPPEIPNGASHHSILATLEFRLRPAGHRRCHPEQRTAYTPSDVELLGLCPKSTSRRRVGSRRDFAQNDTGGCPYRVNEFIGSPFKKTKYSLCS